MAKTPQPASASERILGAFGKRAFLSLWSYPNLYRKKGEEFADLTVVFGDVLIIFSDKEREFGTGAEAWSRWYRRAVERSVKQLHRAEGWIRARSTQLYYDSKCEQLFDIPISQSPEVHLVAVARGAADACRSVHGGSGTLTVAPNHCGEPFTVGDPEPSKPFVHVFDSEAFALVVSELDTATDFLDYLRDREKLFRGGIDFVSPGEEELLALYFRNFDSERGSHHFPSFDAEFVMFEEGLWREFCQSGPYRRRRKADERSYIWDNMIELVAKHVRQGSLVTGHELDLSVHEESLRLMASERRFFRRNLARSVEEVGRNEPSKNVYLRLLSASQQAIPYVFLRLTEDGSLSYDRYREVRQGTLVAYCEVCRLRNPKIERILGIAFDSFSGDDGSIDLLRVDFSDWTDERAETASELAKAYGWRHDLRDVRSVQRGPDYEFPAPAKAAGRTSPGKAAQGARHRKKALRKSKKASRRKSRRK